MDKEKVLEVVGNIKNLLEEKYPDVRGCRHVGVIKDKKDKIEHIKFIAIGLLKKIEEDFENNKGKIFRHLGFLQGVLWALDLQSVNDLKKLNMPKNEKFDDQK